MYYVFCSCPLPSFPHFCIPPILESLRHCHGRSKGKYFCYRSLHQMRQRRRLPALVLQLRLLLSKSTQHGRQTPMDLASRQSTIPTYCKPLLSCSQTSQNRHASRNYEKSKLPSSVELFAKTLTNATEGAGPSTAVNVSKKRKGGHSDISTYMDRPFSDEEKRETDMKLLR